MAVRDSTTAVGIVPLDAPLASFGDINRGEWPGEFHPKTSTIFSYVMNNYWHTNYRAAQGGDFMFRYVVTSSPNLAPDALTRLGSESTRPVELDHIIGQDKPGNPERPLPPEGATFLETDQPNIVLTTWKQAEDEKGSILRLQETARRSTNLHLRLPHQNIRSAYLCNGVEDNLSLLTPQNGSLQLRFNPYEVVTVRLADPL